MTENGKFDVEDFLIDNTFQMYCAGADSTCIAYWEKYIAAHPEQKETIDEAIRLYKILSGNKNRLSEQTLQFKQSFEPKKPTLRIINSVWLKVAAVLIIIAGVNFFFREQSKTGKPIEQAMPTFFSTKAGERKKVILPDGSTVILNAKSSICLGENFNKKLREVTLKGEAFFDVVHDKNKPFKVHTTDFNINVLGTAFNVKAYDDEPSSEATLIRGLITMEATAGDGGPITLKPSQKVTFYKNAPHQVKDKSLKAIKSRPEISINHFTLVKDSIIVETAWTKNRIEIYDQDFEEVKKVLEKWYNVEIKFTNAELKNHRFTATFGNENIKQVLEALQKVEYFKYEIKENQILISK
jgi:transmembrane sensor